MNELGPAIATFVASALGALLAAFYGVRFGLRQYRGERALDRRLQWYANICETTRMLLNRSRAFQFHVDQGDHAEVERLLKELGTLAYQFQELALFAEFYATPGTVQVVQETLNILDGMTPIMARSDAGQANPAEGRNDAMRKSLRVIANTSVLLARDIRRELGLEALDSHRKLP